MLQPAEPADPLKPFVRKYVQLEVSATDLWPVPARSVASIEFTFGEPYRIHRLDGSPVYPAILIGAKTTHETVVRVMAIHQPSEV